MKAEGATGKGREQETKEGVRQGESRSRHRLRNPFCVDFPPSHTAARVQTDAVISILMHFLPVSTLKKKKRCNWSTSLY